ncbi:hypothetical protein [Nocardia jejuensis]|uniref:hypothetical protein n=1 Tax=Nocardia jejuensis TaxID=328049 RepID=UPI0008359936|nr:hypothetical protein [Nocardia jejuensis]
MSTLATAPRSGQESGRVIGALACLAAALGIAFVLGPRWVAGSGFTDEPAVRDGFRNAFVGYWRGGDQEYTPDMQRIVDYWFRYHMAKAVIAALALITLARLGVLLWRRFLRIGGSGLAAGGIAVTTLALGALLLVMANIQGTVAPFAALLPMLTGESDDAQLGATLGDVRQRLADAVSTGERTPPVLSAMIDDFSRYHVVMLVIASIVAVLSAAAAVVCWKRFANTPSRHRRTRRVLAASATLAMLATAAMIVVAVANTTTVADPAPALAALFDGSW